jgi:hypothetical protein
MNERIRILQLADQAYDEYETDATKYEDNIPDEFCKKFAELIVKECAEYVQFYYKDHMCEVIAHDMKQHFGVEE